MLHLLHLHFLLLLSLPVLIYCACPATPSPWPAPASFPNTPTLPDPFLYLDGKTRVSSVADWYACRQPELLKLLQHYQYGDYPDHSLETVTATRSGNTLSITVVADGKTAKFSASVTLPANTATPVPAIIAIGGIDSGVFTAQGVATVTFDYTSVAPDSNAKTGAFWSLYNGRDIGALTAWAWGFHRTIDALTLTVPQVNSSLIAVTGCSRLGKAALAAGLLDTRVALTIPLSSGIQGLGPYRYHALSGQDETLENSKSGAPWWTNNVLAGFVGQSERTPWDAHSIAAAIAPRALVMEQGRSDPYTNSKGTATVVWPAARAVYDWLGVGEKLGMALRDGGHCDNSGFSNVLPFVLKTLKGQTVSRNYQDISPWTVLSAALPWSGNVPPK